MRLRLDELKKRLTRRGETVYVEPYLLKPGELDAELRALIGLYESWVGRSRAEFPEDRAVELVGDYRLARAFTACLSEWYEWRAPAWPGPASAEEAAALAVRDISSPSLLRLALYNEVNATCGGYLPADEREARLDAFAARLEVRRATSDALLRLDAADEAMLTRERSETPDVPTLVARYAQRAVESLVSNASRIEWIVEPELARETGEGLGTIVKRVCFLARRMGVQYDISFADAAPREDAPDENGGLRAVAEAPAEYALRPVERALPERRPLALTLYGPQEMTGAPTQYGERLARLCRALLGYRRSESRARAALGGTALQGRAIVYLHGRPVTFRLDAKVLRALDVVPEDEPLADTTAQTPATDTYDSSLEEDLAAQFASLEAMDAAQGWRLDREPEPLLADGIILIPDFMLTRGTRRIYLEVAGYWRPEYRERKARKLLALAGRVALALIAPTSARAEFADVAERIPTVWYEKRLSAQALLAALAQHYDDLGERLERIDPERIIAEVALRGVLPARECTALLHTYTRTELQAGLARVLAHPAARADAVLWIERVGLCSAAWVEQVSRALRKIVEDAPNQRLPLSSLRDLSVMPIGTPSGTDAAPLGEGAVEALAERAGLSVSRASIFEAEVSLAPAAGGDGVPPPADISEAAPQKGKPSRKVQPRGPVRRKREERERALQQTLLTFQPEETPGDTLQ